MSKLDACIEVILSRQNKTLRSPKEKEEELLVEIRGKKVSHVLLPERPQNREISEAHCYKNEKGFIVVPQCPYCLCQHVHKPPKDGSEEISGVHLSKCLYDVYLYDLVLKPKEECYIPTRCAAIKVDGSQCMIKRSKDLCVCYHHVTAFHKALLDRCVVTAVD